ncbi:MAG: hypothetical protein HY049_01830 [Acidobacteria bacterium]|nr:hypothetical protein [Acidobacteriota bacterium]
MSRHARSGSLVMGIAVMVLVAGAVLSSGVIARAATPERCAVAPAGMSQEAPASGSQAAPRLLPVRLLLHTRLQHERRLRRRRVQQGAELLLSS